MENFVISRAIIAVYLDFIANGKQVVSLNLGHRNIWKCTFYFFLCFSEYIYCSLAREVNYVIMPLNNFCLSTKRHSGWGADHCPEHHLSCPILYTIPHWNLQAPINNITVASPRLHDFHKNLSTTRNWASKGLWKSLCSLLGSGQKSPFLCCVAC